MDEKTAQAIGDLVAQQLAEFLKEHIEPLKARGVVMDPQEMARGTVAAVKAYVQREKEPLLRRIDTVEGYVQRAQAPLVKRIEELEKRMGTPT